MTALKIYEQSAPATKDSIVTTAYLLGAECDDSITRLTTATFWGYRNEDAHEAQGILHLQVPSQTLGQPPQHIRLSLVQFRYLIAAYQGWAGEETQPAAPAETDRELADAAYSLYTHAERAMFSRTTASDDDGGLGEDLNETPGGNIRRGDLFYALHHMREILTQRGIMAPTSAEGK
jgi:hypothetical protein